MSLALNILSLVSTLVQLVLLLRLYKLIKNR